VDKRGRAGKKGAGWHPPWGWHTSEISIKWRWWAKIGVTPSVAAPSDTHPSDATVFADEICIDLMQISTAVGLIETRMQTINYKRLADNCVVE